MGDYFYGMGLLPEDDSPVAYTDRTPSQRETPLVNHISVSDPRHTRRQSTEQPYSSPMRCSSGHIEIKPPKYNSFPQTSRLSNSPAVTSPLTTLKSPAFAERRKSDERKDTKGKKPTTSNNFYNYDFGFDALGIPTEQFRDHRSGSAGDQKLPPLSKAESGHRLASASDADNRKRDVHLPPISLSKKEANLSRMDSLGTRTITSTILARQLPMAGELASSGSFDRVDDASSIRPLKNPLYGYSDPSSSSSVSSGTDSSDEDAEEIPLVTSMTQIIPKSPKKLMNLLARYSCYGINPPSADSPQDDFVRDLFSSRYNTKYDVHSEWSNSLSSVGISAVSSPDFKQLGDVAPGVTGWIGPPPRGSMEHIMEHAGGDQFAREADMDTWETVDGLVVIDHDGKQPSSSAAVTNDNRRILVAGGLGGGTGYDTDECVFRQKGCTALPSALLSESRKRFCRNGESVFTVYVDRSEAGKRTNMPVTPVRNIGCSVVKECLQYNAEFKEITSDLKLSLIYYIEGGEYIDLISRSTKDTEIRQLDVAQSPIFGPCVDNCQWLLLETIDDFSELLNRCEEPVDPKLSGILVAQFLFQSFLPPPEGSRHKIGDVVMSSFSLACTSSPKTLTPILEQRPGSQWRLFKYALCKGPCIVLSCINICENDQDAADSLRILQKMKSIPHPRPRRGSVADYITRQREEVANLEWRKGFGKTENKTMDVALNKAKASIEDAVTFIKDPQNVHIPLYVDAKRRGSSFFLGSASEFLRCRKINGRSPQGLVMLKPKRSATSGTSQDKGRERNRIVVENNALQIVSRNSTGQAPSFIFNEIASIESDSTKVNTLDKIQDLTLDGFNTSCILSTPKEGTTRAAAAQLFYQNASMLVDNGRGLVRKALSGSTARRGKKKDIRLSVSFVWVGVDVTDLLDGKRRIPFKMCFDPVHGWFPRGASKTEVSDLGAFNNALAAGQTALKEWLETNEGSENGYVLLRIEVRQIVQRKGDKNALVISCMTNVFLGDNYNLLDAVLNLDATQYEKSANPSLLLLAAYVLGPMVTVCAALVNPDEPTPDLGELLSVVKKTTNLKAQNVPHGSLSNVIEYLKRAREKLQESDTPTSLQDATRKTLATMIADLEKAKCAVNAPLTTYERWKNDFKMLELCGLFSHPSVDTVNSANRRGIEGGVAPGQTQNYGVNYAKDPVYCIQSQPQRTPAVIVLNKTETSNLVRVTSPTSLEVCYKGIPSKEVLANDIVVISEDSQGLKSKSLACAVSCVAAGRSAALVAFDTEEPTNLTSISWLTLRTSINRLFMSLQSRPSSVSIRIALISNKYFFDLLSGTDKISIHQLKVENVKTSPLCGPILYDAVSIPVASAEEVDNALGIAVSTAETLKKLSNGEVKGSVAVHLVVHQVVKRTRASQKWTKGWSVDTSYLKRLGKDTDVLLSSLWCINDGSLCSEWLKSSPSVSKESALDHFKEYLLGGPCFTTAVFGLTSFNPRQASTELVKFRQSAEVYDSVRSLLLKQPRFGSLALYEALLNSVLEEMKKRALNNTRSSGEEGTARITALLMEVRVVMQRSPTSVAQVDKPLSTLAHDKKFFALLDRS